MKWFNVLGDRIRALRQREAVINDIDREMRLHLEMQVEANIKAGMSAAEARERVMRSFGNLNRAVAAAYDVIRTDDEPTAIAPAVQREIRALDPNQPVSDVRTMNQVMSEWVARSRFNTLLLGLLRGSRRCCPPLASSA
jgi:hypothetical protein